MNAGKNWIKSATLNWGCYDMVIHPYDPDIFFVLSPYSVLKSTNGGASWTAYSLGSRNYGYNGQIAIDPQNPDVLHIAGYHSYSYAGYCMATFKSTDGGASWTAKLFNSSSRSGRAYCIAVSPSSPNILYLGGYYSDGFTNVEKVYKSTDSGDSWQDVTGPIDTNPYSIIIDPTNSSKVYVGTNWSVYRSSDSGQTWKKGEGRVYAYALAMDPSNPETIYTGYNKNCFKSADGGITWTEYKAGLCGTCQDILVCSGRVYYGSYAGLYKSLDGGTTWEASHLGIKNNVIPAIAVARSSPEVIYAEASQNGLFKSTDFGSSWRRLPDFYRCDSIYTICVNSSNPNDLVLLAGG
jgi:photosystem II stability/assembly factor-like uncharacterized protein